MSREEKGERKKEKGKRRKEKGKRKKLCVSAPLRETNPPYYINPIKKGICIL